MHRYAHATYIKLKYRHDVLFVVDFTVIERQEILCSDFIVPHHEMQAYDHINIWGTPAV